MTYCKCCRKKLKPNREGGRIDCQYCGTINYVRREEFDTTGWLESFAISRETLWALLIGAVSSFVITFMDFPFLSFILDYFNTLVHELGHTLMSIALGFPALPAFDFQHGGGVTIHLEEPNNTLRILVFCGLAIPLWYFRKYKTILLIPIATIAFILACLKFHWEELAILVMGHGTVLLMSWIFLFRGLSNVAVHNYAEKIAYFFLGFFSVFCEFRFAVKVISDDDFRFRYFDGKGGVDNDFVRLSENLNTTVDILLGYHIIACFAVPVLAYISYVYAMKYYSQ